MEGAGGGGARVSRTFVLWEVWVPNEAALTEVDLVLGQLLVDLPKPPLPVLALRLVTHHLDKAVVDGKVVPDRAFPAGLVLALPVITVPVGHATFHIAAP